MAETMEQQQQQNVVVRLINLPFVSSTYDMVSSTYVTTKDNHPYLKSVCDVAEKSVKSITSVAITSAMPILQKLEPQIALANNIACVGLDKIEERLPILYQSSEKVVANASEAVVGARDAVIHSITGVVDKTKGAVQESVEMSKAVVNGSINTVLGSRVVQIISDRVDSALTRSEYLLEQYLPQTDEELAKDTAETQGIEMSQDKPGYYMRLGSLSTKARKRAYQQALTSVKDAKCRSQEAIAQLQNTIDLIEYARKNMNNANQKIHDAQENIYNKWVEWTKGSREDAGGETEGAEIESRTLAIARHLANHLQSTCLSLVSSVQGLQQNLQNKAQSISAMAADIYQNFHSASSFRDMSDSLLTATKDKITQIKDGMDEMITYFINNTPLNWLVGHFTPELAGSQDKEEEIDDGGSDKK
ncbi:perilipin-2-like isoform X2 [Anomaloglossus baeobatrachus]|uniref:perilipin-2-like isoform X2 n=1 Tax=Anomaloglossus baeobatrachus TaxID=238106 RepID=UPI003F4F9CB6